MLKMRLQRIGRKNDPSFRIVVVEGTEGPRTGNHIDLVGFYNAVTKEKRVDGEKAKQWIAKGAQPSDTVYNMLVTEGVLSGKKRNALPKKTPIAKDQPADLPANDVQAGAPAQAGEPKAEVSAEAAEVAPETPAEVPAPEAVPAEETSKEGTPVEAPVERPKEEPKEDQSTEALAKEEAPTA